MHEKTCDIVTMYVVCACVVFLFLKLSITHLISISMGSDKMMRIWKILSDKMFCISDRSGESAKRAQNYREKSKNGRKQIFHTITLVCHCKNGFLCRIFCSGSIQLTVCMLRTKIQILKMDFCKIETTI